VIALIIILPFCFCRFSAMIVFYRFVFLLSVGVLCGFSPVAVVIVFYRSNFPCWHPTNILPFQK
jgi:hypothetical protein